MDQEIPTIKIGTMFVRVFQFMDSAGTAIDLTGQVIAARIAGVFPNDDPLILVSGEPDTPNGSKMELTDAENGIFTLTLTDEETAEMVATDTARIGVEMRDEDDSPTAIWTSDLIVETYP